MRVFKKYSRLVLGLYFWLFCKVSFAAPPCHRLLTLSDQLQNSYGPVLVLNNGHERRRITQTRFIRTSQGEFIITAGVDFNLRVFFNSENSVKEEPTQLEVPFPYVNRPLIRRIKNGLAGDGIISMSQRFSPDTVMASRDGSFIVVQGGISNPTFYSFPQLNRIQISEEQRIQQTRPVRHTGFEFLFLTPNEQVLAITSRSFLTVYLRQKEVFSYFSPLELIPRTQLVSASLSKDGSQLALATSDQKVHIFLVSNLIENVTRAGSKRPSRLPTPIFQVGKAVDRLMIDSIAFDSNLLAVGYSFLNEEIGNNPISHSEVQIFNLNKPTAAPLVLNNAHEYSSIDQLFLLERKGVIISVSSDPESSVKIWNFTTGKHIATIQVERDSGRRYLSDNSGPYDPIFSSAISPDLKTFVFGTDGGNLVGLNTEDGSVLFSIRTQGTDLRGLSFSSDGKRLVIGGHLGFSAVYEIPH